MTDHHDNTPAAPSPASQVTGATAETLARIPDKLGLNAETDEAKLNVHHIALQLFDAIVNSGQSGIMDGQAQMPDGQMSPIKVPVITVGNEFFNNQVVNDQRTRGFIGTALQVLGPVLAKTLVLGAEFQQLSMEVDPLPQGGDVLKAMHVVFTPDTDVETLLTKIRENQDQIREAIRDDIHGHRNQREARWGERLMSAERQGAGMLL